MLIDVAKYIGAYAAAMNGVDDIVFTAGIGENVQLCTRAGMRAIWDILVLNLILMRMRSSEASRVRLPKPGCKVRVFVIPTNEELAIARETLALVK